MHEEQAQDVAGHAEAAANIIELVLTIRMERQKYIFTDTPASKLSATG
jgi:hypothetical protein